MKTVTPTTVLDYYDGIQIFAAQDATGGHYIGTMVGTEGGYWRYLITGVSPADLHLFRCGEMDLRALLLASPTDERFITVATGKFSDPLRLTAVEEPLEQTAFLPKEGFFLEEEAIEDTPVSEAEAGNQRLRCQCRWQGTCHYPKLPATCNRKSPNPCVLRPTTGAALHRNAVCFRRRRPARHCLVAGGRRLGTVRPWQLPVSAQSSAERRRI